MDPFNHHHHHHHHHADDDDENRRHQYPPPDHQPPPPSFPTVQHVSHEYNPPPAGFHPFQHASHDRPSESYGYDRPHESHAPAPGHGYGYGYERPPEAYAPAGGYYGSSEEGRHEYRPHHESAPAPSYFSGVQHVSHETPVDEEGEGERRKKPQGQSYRIYPRADEGFSLTIRNGQVVLARDDPEDEYQHWIKDLKYSTKVKDAEGFPAFALVNKVTGEAIKHAIGQHHPVRLIQYNPDYLDESVLWSESKDVGHGFRCIRMVNNIHLNFDAFNGDKDHGGIKDGTTIVLWEWCKGDNQRWKIVPR